MPRVRIELTCSCLRRILSPNLSVGSTVVSSPSLGNSVTECNRLAQSGRGRGSLSGSLYIALLPLAFALGCADSLDSSSPQAFVVACSQSVDTVRNVWRGEVTATGGVVLRDQNYHLLFAMPTGCSLRAFAQVRK